MWAQISSGFFPCKYCKAMVSIKLLILLCPGHQNSNTQIYNKALLLRGRVRPKHSEISLCFPFKHLSASKQTEDCYKQGENSGRERRNELWNQQPLSTVCERRAEHLCSLLLLFLLVEGCEGRLCVTERTKVTFNNSASYVYPRVCVWKGREFKGQQRK